ncbi:hypothetical protein [Amycolatopsis tolypomycina]|uniref:hypothetical protein n=1 Tax=Amycolatopsis tolypomycina TaxID=208445 RepID=UPI0033A9F5F6
MTRTVCGYADLDALIATLGLDNAGATVSVGEWPSILIRMAAHWFDHLRPAGGRIVLASPTVLPRQPPAHQRRSSLIDTTTDFAVIAVETVKALAGLLADDQARNALRRGRRARRATAHRPRRRTGARGHAGRHWRRRHDRPHAYHPAAARPRAVLD